MKLLDLEKGSDLVCSNVWDIKTENQNINICVPRLLSAGQCIKSSNEDECFLVSLPVFSMRQSLSHSVTDGPIYWWRTSHHPLPACRQPWWGDHANISGHQHQQAPELTLKMGTNIAHFPFSRARHWERDLCVGHWSILVWGIRVNLHWPVDPISVGCQPGQLAVCSRMRTPVWITSIRTQPETFSFTLLTSAGSKLKSCSPPLRWCKQF